MSKRCAQLFAVVLALALGCGAARADMVLVSASDNATIQPGGPRPGANGKAFFNVEGSANGTGIGGFASFGVIDFDTSLLHASSLTGASLVLTQANAAFTHNGALSFFLAPDTTTSIQPGASPLRFLGSALPGGVDTQLGSLVSLGPGTFTQGTGGPFGDGSGTVDTFTLGISPAAAALLTSEINAGKVRLVVAANDANVSATYSGLTNNSFAGPQLELNGTITPVPEPASLTLFGTGVLGLVGWTWWRTRKAGKGTGQPE
jgi:hypothetical protein